MATNSGKKARKAANMSNSGFVNSFEEPRPLNYIQETYVEAIHNKSIIFGTGSAGTGKTYLAAAYAAKQLFYKRVDKVILTRPNIEVGRGLGFLPGELEEKYLPYLAPFEGTFIKLLGKGYYDYCIKEKVIDPKPLGFMRGATFENCIVLVDEVQNMTKEEFKMILSRIGKNCKMIFSGDPLQVDIKDSGLADALKRVEKIEGVEVVNFLPEDIVRSSLCKQIIISYNDKYI